MLRRHKEVKCRPTRARVGDDFQENVMNTIKKTRPAAPIARWLGGKSKLAKTLIERIDRIPHKTYIEPFVGMGGVFLRRSWKPLPNQRLPRS